MAPQRERIQSCQLRPQCWTMCETCITQPCGAQLRDQQWWQDLAAADHTEYCRRMAEAQQSSGLY